VTVDYTALDDVDLRARVIAGLDRRMAGSRALSLRHDFPDAWYELNNPQLIEDPVRRMVVTVTTMPGDSPPNVDDIRIGDVAMLVARSADATAETQDISGVTTRALGRLAAMRPPGSACRSISSASAPASLSLTLMAE
jgi:hypothetical protein